MNIFDYISMRAYYQLLKNEIDNEEAWDKDMNRWDYTYQKRLEFLQECIKAWNGLK